MDSAIRLYLRWARVGLALASLSLSGCDGSTADPAFDVVIVGGSVIDGNGTPAVNADVGLRDG